MAEFANYDPKDIEVIVAGSILTGFAEEKVTVAREANIADDEVGANGDVARAINNDKRGTITITLLQSSTSNLILSGLAKADEFTGTGVFPVIIKDTRGKDLHAAPQAWIQKYPETKYSKGIETREWVIRTNNLQMLVGGA